jgi:hypothetical protein
MLSSKSENSITEKIGHHHNFLSSRISKSDTFVSFPNQIFTTETQSSRGSTVREASRQASSTAFSSEPVEESPRAEFFIAAHPELIRRMWSSAPPR